MWQDYLESKFPGTSEDSASAQRTNKMNVAKKVVLDQTVGAVVNSAAFASFFSAATGNDMSAIWRSVYKVSIYLRPHVEIHAN